MKQDFLICPFDDLELANAQERDEHQKESHPGISYAQWKRAELGVAARRARKQREELRREQRRRNRDV